MNKLSRWFINGLLAFLPISITLYVAWWIASLAESTFGAPIRRWLGVRADHTGGYYFYGLGLAFMVIFLVVVGLCLEFYMGKVLMGWSENLLSKIPGIKQLYSSVKEIIDFFNPETKLRKNNYMVIVTLMEDIRVLGYVTRDTMDTFRGGQLGGRDDVVVILPFCYQMGGNTIIVPRDRVKPVDLSFEEGMKIALSGFVLGGESKDKEREVAVPALICKAAEKASITTMRERGGS